MSRLSFGLSSALILSTLFHLVPFAASLLTPAPSTPPPPSPALQARLAPPPPSDIPLSIDPPSPTPAPKPPPREIPPRSPSTAGKPSAPAWQQAIRQQFSKQQANGEFYPAEAIAQGLQGEVLVLMMLDEQGKVSAARVEQGCGFPILDQAALQAVRKLHTLPADTPREIVLPVRFRLR